MPPDLNALIASLEADGSAELARFPGSEPAKNRRHAAEALRALIAERDTLRDGLDWIADCLGVPDDQPTPCAATMGELIRSLRRSDDASGEQIERLEAAIKGL